MAQPAGELMHHQPGGNVGCIDRAAGRATADLGFGLCEQRRRIVRSSLRIGDGDDAQHFAEHSTVAPKATAMLHRAPDRLAGGDGIDGTEDSRA